MKDLINRYFDGELTELTDDLAGTVDLAVTVGVLHHVPDDTGEQIVASAHHALRPGGRFVVLEPHLHEGQNPISRALSSAIEASSSARRATTGVSSRPRSRTWTRPATRRCCGCRTRW